MQIQPFSLQVPSRAKALEKWRGQSRAEASLDGGSESGPGTITPFSSFPFLTEAQVWAPPPGVPGAQMLWHVERGFLFFSGPRRGLWTAVTNFHRGQKDSKHRLSCLFLSTPFLKILEERALPLFLAPPASHFSFSTCLHIAFSPSAFFYPPNIA